MDDSNSSTRKVIKSMNNPKRTILKVMNNKDISHTSSSSTSKKQLTSNNNNKVNNHKNYEQKYTDEFENTKNDLDEGNTNDPIKKDTFLTGVPVAPSPIPPKPDELQKNGLVKIEERLNEVNSTQASLRAELEAYVNEVRGRTGDDGERLVEFPENFAKNKFCI